MQAREFNIGNDKIKELSRHATSIRKNIIEMLSMAGSGHTAGSLDVVEILVALYGALMNYEPSAPDWANRDEFILSAGHLCPALYATLSEFGMIKHTELMTLRQFGSRLQGHPERARLPFLETTSGPLGEGLSQAAGIAYAIKYLDRNSRRRVFCLMGDGECDEGQIWEAAMTCGKYELDNLIGIVDCNGIQLSGTTRDVLDLQPIGDKWRASGWEVYTISNGNDMVEALDIITAAINDDVDRPRIVLAMTTPGRGVSFIEDDYRWHGKVPTKAQAVRALAELNAMEGESCQEAEVKNG